jgi:hypothetical protein
MAAMSLFVRIFHQSRALRMRCLSYRKRNWELADYPVIFRAQEPDPNSQFRAPRFKMHRYTVSIVNWHLAGSGDSREEALESLDATFQAEKLKKEGTGDPLPRPGVNDPIVFASQERVHAHSALADDFIDRVLILDGAWISDESSLWDFHTNEDNGAYYAKIEEIYGVDVSDIESAKLCEIFERISVERRPG